MPKYYQQYSKKSLQVISKANYIKDFILPNSPKSQKDQAFKILKSTHGNKNQKYFYIDQQEAETQVPISPSILLNAFKKIYPGKNCSKIDSHSFVNTHLVNANSLLEKPKEFQELIDIVIVEKGNSQSSQSQTSRRTYVKLQSMSTLSKSEKDSKDYDAYIVHFVYSPQEKETVKWEMFVEKYVFTNLSDNQSQPLVKITYSLVFCFTHSTCRSYSFLNFVSSNNSTINFIHSYFDSKKGNEERLKKLQSYLFHLSQLKQEYIEQVSQDFKLPCFSIELKRQRKVPAEHFMEYKKLKDKMLRTYKNVNQEYIQKGEIKDVEMKVENLVCRFLIQHDYDFQKTSKQLSEFLVFEYDLRKNFRMQHFKYWIDMDIITKIGSDRMGRPVILFKTYNFFAQKCVDVSDYINFLFYFILVDTMSQCGGYVDELILLADCSNNTMKNMKVEVNRRMVPTGLKYCPRLFAKLIPFRCTAVPYYAYTLAKPLLPSYSSEVILMVKQGDERLALQQCLKWMDIEVVPETIGGKNSNCKDISEKNLSTRDE